MYSILVMRHFKAWTYSEEMLVLYWHKESILKFSKINVIYTKKTPRTPCKITWRLQTGGCWVATVRASTGGRGGGWRILSFTIEWEFLHFILCVHHLVVKKYWIRSCEEENSAESKETNWLFYSCLTKIYKGYITTYLWFTPCTWLLEGFLSNLSWYLPLQLPVL